MAEVGSRDGDERDPPASPTPPLQAHLLALLADPVQGQGAHGRAARTPRLAIVRGAGSRSAEPATRRSSVAAMDSALARLAGRHDPVACRPADRRSTHASISRASTSPEDALHPRAAGLARPGGAGAPRRPPTARVTNPYERQAVITMASRDARGRRPVDGVGCHAARQPGQEPVALLPDERSSARNARWQARNADALAWYGKAFDRSEGPATRLQWGATYLNALVDLAPQDSKRIEDTARTIFAEKAAAQPQRVPRTQRAVARDASARSSRGGTPAACSRRPSIDSTRSCRPAATRCLRTNRTRATCDSLLKADAGKAAKA